MTVLNIILSALFFSTLGFAYCKGWDYVKKNMPGYLVHYYLVSATLRFLLVAAVILAYIRLSGVGINAKLLSFVLMFLGMYVAMMVITLWLKHK